MAGRSTYAKYLTSFVPAAVQAAVIFVTVQTAAALRSLTESFSGLRIKESIMLSVNQIGRRAMKQHVSIEKGTANTGAMDFSRLLDAPAGKHGFVKARQGHLYFEAGTRARFIGLSLLHI